MGPWIIIGSFHDGERILAKAENLLDACLSVQENHLKYLDKGLEEIWYTEENHENRS